MKNRLRDLARQRGSVFVVTLVMLVLMTLLAVSAIRTSTSMVQIVGNAQFREEATWAGQQVIDRLIGMITADTGSGIEDKALELNDGGTGQTVDVNGDTTGDYRVVLDPPPACIYRENAKAYVDAQIPIERGIATSTDVAMPEAVKEAAKERYSQLLTCIANKDLPNQCYWSNWRVVARVTDPFTGVSTNLTQGVRILIGIEDTVNNCIT